MRKKLEFQYYYKVNECKADNSQDADCICWHNERTGPFKDEKHDAEIPFVDWRITPNYAF